MFLEKLQHNNASYQWRNWRFEPGWGNLTEGAHKPTLRKVEK